MEWGQTVKFITRNSRSKAKDLVDHVGWRVFFFFFGGGGCRECKGTGQKGAFCIE